MLTLGLEQRRAAGAAARLFTLFEKLVPRHREREPRAPLRQDLERLALSAPHMLADIGFARDPKASSPGRTVWRRGPLCVVVSAVAPEVSVSGP
ncbi:hypothetical protein [Jannaschia seohaensis]|uniref:Uncharacterized protein n=1 Tax=Jannaschia seohaensis TaxID=475081 RepID=A0A2Y9B2J9_9RHOB|nr:hypothetical protein [Jannaschia seohaensis]PWJ12868.1 hypothetical protein BCF38_1154 [Jannaschia seohaensis]SSA50676.1 hypothetical protein SAMN05421539_1154 [Jannaschia seohaensis]